MGPLLVLPHTPLGKAPVPKRLEKSSVLPAPGYVAQGFSTPVDKGTEPCPTGSHGHSPPKGDRNRTREAARPAAATGPKPRPGHKMRTREGRAGVLPTLKACKQLLRATESETKNTLKNTFFNVFYIMPLASRPPGTSGSSSETVVENTVANVLLPELSLRPPPHLWDHVKTKTKVAGPLVKTQLGSKTLHLIHV